MIPGLRARAFLLAEILGAVSFLGWLLLALRQAHDTKRVSHAVRFGARVAFLVLAAGWLASLLPGLRAYRLSLADGLSPRI